MGREVPPADITPEAVFIAVEEQAKADKDAATLLDLATTSTLSSEATAMGQRIRTLGERDPDSPVSAIREVQRARQEGSESKYAKRLKKSKTKEAKRAISKSMPNLSKLDQFINELAC
jgi:ERCC4-type nuclease